MKNWIYKDKEILDINQFPSGSYGFIYRIDVDETSKFYIGKKNLYSNLNVKLGKKALASLTDKRLSKKKKVTKESDWKTYFGSEAVLKEDIKKYGYNNIQRTILHISDNKASLTYQEVRHQILLGCLESDTCYNGQVLGKFWKKVA